MVVADPAKSDERPVYLDWTASPLVVGNDSRLSGLVGGVMSISTSERNGFSVKRLGRLALSKNGVQREKLQHDSD